MKQKLDKPLIGLGVVGIIGGAVIYHCLDAEIFCFAALFWLLICYLWQNNEQKPVTWWERMIAVVTEAVLWVLMAAVWYGLGWSFCWLTSWSVSLEGIYIVQGAILHLIGWQLYDIGITKCWWNNIWQYAGYLASMLVVLVMIKKILIT